MGPPVEERRRHLGVAEDQGSRHLFRDGAIARRPNVLFADRRELESMPVECSAAGRPFVSPLDGMISTHSA